MKKQLQTLLFFLLMCIVGQLQSQTNSQEKKQRIEQNAAIGKENLKEFFSLLFFDAASAAEFNIVTDNGLAEFVGNRKLRQTIDFFKDQKLTGVCVRCYIDSDQRWAKMLNFKTPEGNCDTTDGGHSLIFDIALQPLSEGKGAKYKPVITYRAYPNGEYNRTIKSDDIKKFEEYMKNDSSNLMLTNSEFIPKLNDIILTALLRLMGSDAVPVVVELTPKDKSLAYDSCVSSATQQYYQQINLHGKTTYARWVSIEKGKSLEVEGKITKMLPDTSQESNMQLQLKRNESKLIEYSSGDSTFVYSVPGINNNNDDNCVKAIYNVTNNKGLDVLAGQLGVAAYKKETLKVVIVPINNVTPPSTDAIKSKLNTIYNPAIIEWEVTIEKNLTHSTAIHIDKEGANTKNPYDKSMLDLIKAYNKKERKTRYIFLIDKFANEGGTSAAEGYMPYQQQYGFVTATGSIARNIAHELGHGAFGLKHTFEPEYGIDDRYNNLMGYGKGDTARLFKFQWDIAHEKAGETDFDNAEDVMKRSNDEMFYDLLQRIRCALASNRTTIYIPFLKNKSEDFYTLNINGLDFIRARIEWSDKPKSYIEIPRNLPVPEKAGFVDLGIAAYSYKFGLIKILIPQTDKEKFEQFIKNTSFEKEYLALTTYLNEKNSDKAIEKLLNSSYCIYEKLTNNQRKQIFKALSEKFSLSEEYEDMVINLIRSLNETTSTEIERKEIIQYILYKKIDKLSVKEYIKKDLPKTIFESFKAGIGNFGGKDNYDLFILELTKLFRQTYLTSNFKVGINFNWYIKGNYVLSSDNGYVDITNLKWHGIIDDNVNRTNPRTSIPYGEIVHVSLSPEIDFPFAKKVSNQYQPITVPAFALEYLVEVYVNNTQAELAKKTLIIIQMASAISGFAALTNASVIQKIVAGLNVIEPILAEALLDEKVQDNIRKLNGGRTLLMCWEYYQTLETVVGGVSGMSKVINAETFWMFTQLTTAWDVVSKDPNIDKYLDKNKIQKITKEMIKIKKAFNDEGIVY